MAQAYPDSATHLHDELERVDQLVRAQAERFRAGIGAVKPPGDWGIPGIAENELYGYLAADFAPMLATGEEGGRAGDPGVTAQGTAAAVHLAAAASIADRITARLAATGSPPRLERLRRHYGLDRIAVDLLLVSLLPEVNPGYRRLFAALMDDATQTLPTVELVGQILAPQAPGAATMRRLLAGPLVGEELVVLGHGNEGLPARTIRVDARIVDFLLGLDRPDGRLPGVLRDAPEPPTWGSLVLEPALAEQLTAFAGHLTPIRIPTVVVLRGPYGSGRRTVASALCREAGLPLLLADVRAALIQHWPSMVRLCYREAVLRGSALCWTGAEALFDDAERYGDDARRETLVEAASRFPGLTLVTSERTWEITGRVGWLDVAGFEFGVPSFAQRRRLWQLTLPSVLTDESKPPKPGDGPKPPKPGDGPKPQESGYAAESPEPGDGPEPEPDGRSGRLAALLANAFQLTPGQVADAVATARGIARVRDPHRSLPTADDLYEGCRRQAGRRLVAFAHRVEPRPGLSFDDLVLPAANRRQLDELRARIAFGDRVFEEFGFDRRITSGRGVVAMFTGASGNGKTMAAELLAREHGADLYKVDLAAVVSKYVGETEKNLDRVFGDAERANAMLFFDEADALFGKRGEVKDARDRWANVEMAFLLQRIEEHRGVVILASNLRQNIDEAFLRRLHAVVDFPTPDARARLRIWKGMFPDGFDHPADEVLADLARRFPMPGGSIRNVVLDAAFRALGADEHATGVSPRDLVVSIGREYVKLRLPITPGDFGPDHYRWIEQDLLLEEARTTSEVA